MMADDLLEALRGRWALVTGASGGIGKAFCEALAGAGLNLVLVARQLAPLEKLAAQLQGRGIRCLPLAQDLAAPDCAERLRQAVEAEGVEIALLVNNAGIGHWGAFESADAGTLVRLVQVDAQAPVLLCRAFEPHLARQAPAAAVINVSSQAAYQPVPWMAVYGATKAFVHSFSLALYEEWRGRGIHVQTLVPGPTESGFDQRAGAYRTAKPIRREPPEKAVKASLAGLAKRRPVVASVGGIYGQRLFAGLFPPTMVTREVAKMFRPLDEG